MSFFFLNRNSKERDIGNCLLTQSIGKKNRRKRQETAITKSITTKWPNAGVKFQEFQLYSLFFYSYHFPQIKIISSSVDMYFSRSHKLWIFFTWRHGGHIGVPKQWNGGHVSAPNNSSRSWTLFSCKRFLCSNKFAKMLSTWVETLHGVVKNQNGSWNIRKIKKVYIICFISRFKLCLIKFT